MSFIDRGMLDIFMILVKDSHDTIRYLLLERKGKTDKPKNNKNAKENASVVRSSRFA